MLTGTLLAWAGIAFHLAALIAASALGGFVRDGHLFEVRGRLTIVLTTAFALTGVFLLVAAGGRG